MVRVNDIRAIAHWGNPEPPPASAIVNINYSTTWVLGIQNDQHDGKENQKLYLGYYEMTYLNLAEIDGLNESCAMYHTYEVSLSPLGEELVNLNNRNHIFHESEDMMKRTMQQLTRSTPDNDIVLSETEIGTLSIITQ